MIVLNEVCDVLTTNKNITLNSGPVPHFTDIIIALLLDDFILFGPSKKQDPGSSDILAGFQNNNNI